MYIVCEEQTPMCVRGIIMKFVDWFDEIYKNGDSRKISSCLKASSRFL